MLYLHVTFRNEAFMGRNKRLFLLKDVFITGMHCCFNRGNSAAVNVVQQGDFHLSITEPSPGEPAISMLTSAMEILQLLFDVSEWTHGERRRRRFLENLSRWRLWRTASLSYYIQPSYVESIQPERSVFWSLVSSYLLLGLGKSKKKYMPLRCIYSVQFQYQFLKSQELTL